MAPQSLVLVPLFCLVMLARHSEPWGLLSNHKCTQSLRHVKSHNPWAEVNLLENDWKWKDFSESNANTWSDSIECYSDVSCETYRCKDEKGNDIFVINACAKEKIKDEKSTKCTNDELEPYCTSSSSKGKPVCSQCYGADCNKDRIELEVREVETATKPAGNDKTNEPSGTAFSKTNKVRSTKKPPKPAKNTELHCLLEKICKATDAKNQPYKLSRRFAPRKPKNSKKRTACMDRKKLETKMQDVKDPLFNQYTDLSKELKRSKDNDEMKMMFMDEYLLAIEK
uniref:Uncharacterized protein n=1 Tax=Globodera rostochiensis TaxID=31243 RepID=A0A914H4G9_GLORO